MSKKDLTKVTVGYTHAGVFHADDVFSAAFLQTLYPLMEIKRVFKVPEEINDDDQNSIIFDIGLGQFDHHQADAECREDGTKYAAFGLLWREFGHLTEIDDVGLKHIEENLVKPIDICDNGLGRNPISDLISAMNPNWDEEVDDQNYPFFKAVNQAKQMIKVLIEREKSRIHAVRLVEYSLLEAQHNSKCYVKFNTFVPWQDTIIPAAEDAGIDWVIFPSNRGGYVLQGIPVSFEDKTIRKPFPEEWLGNPPKEKGMTFCHPGNWISNTETEEQAIAIAEELSV